MARVHLFDFINIYFNQTQGVSSVAEQHFGASWEAPVLPVL